MYINIQILTKVTALFVIMSKIIQTVKLVAAEIWVLIIAIEAMPLAASAEPPLNPNQPNHRSAVPKL